MQEFLPDNILGWVSFFVMVTTAVMTVFYALSNKKKEIDKENEDLEKTLKNNYKDRIEQLELLTTEQTKQIDTLKRKVTELEASNKTLSDVLGGSGEEATRFRKEGFEAMKEMKQMQDELTTIKTNGEYTLKNIERLFTIIEEHLANERKIVGKVINE